MRLGGVDKKKEKKKGGGEGLLLGCVFSWFFLSSFFRRFGSHCYRARVFHAPRREVGYKREDDDDLRRK